MATHSKPSLSAGGIYTDATTPGFFLPETKFQFVKMNIPENYKIPSNLMGRGEVGT